MTLMLEIQREISPTNAFTVYAIIMPVLFEEMNLYCKSL